MTSTQPRGDYASTREYAGVQPPQPRSADQPQKVVQLVRAQERELRAWLFEGELPGTVGESASSLVAGVQEIALGGAFADLAQ